MVDYVCLKVLKAFDQHGRERSRIYSKMLAPCVGEHYMMRKMAETYRNMYQWISFRENLHRKPWFSPSNHLQPTPFARSNLCIGRKSAIEQGPQQWSAGRRMTWGILTKGSLSNLCHYKRTLPPHRPLVS